MCIRDRSVDDAEEPAGGEHQPGDVKPAVGAAALAEAEDRQGTDHQPDRHVDPEDPVPGEAADHRPADDRAEGDTEAADARPDAEGQPPPAGGKRLGEEGQGRCV